MSADGSLADAVSRSEGPGLDESEKGVDGIVHGVIKGMNILVAIDGPGGLSSRIWGLCEDDNDHMQRRHLVACWRSLPPKLRGRVPESRDRHLGTGVLRCPVEAKRHTLIYKIGYTRVLPEVVPWLSAEAKDFHNKCF